MDIQLVLIVFLALCWLYDHVWASKWTDTFLDTFRYIIEFLLVREWSTIFYSVPVSSTITDFRLIWDSTL
jgi:hypothetical protein